MKSHKDLELMFAHLATDVLMLRQQFKELSEECERLSRRAEDFHRDIRNMVSRLESPKAIAVLDMRDGINQMHDKVLRLEGVVDAMTKTRKRARG